MPNKTEHYQLNQWDPEDDFLRTDFNEDNAKIDAALGSKCGVVFGTYVGDGTASRTISIGFTPDILYTCTQHGNAGSPSGSQMIYGGLCAPGHPVGGNVITIVENGFRLTHNDNAFLRPNLTNMKYHYIAFRT